MQITLYRNLSDNDHVDKNIQYIASFNDCKFKEEYDQIRPTIIMTNFDITANYVYIDTTDRFYFIEKYNKVGKLYIVELLVDILSSVKDRLRNIYALVERNEFEYDPYMFDDELITRCDKTVITQNIGRVGVSGPNYNYYLCVNGGGMSGN